ncbi:hypothetical protein QJS10_CPB20g00880 [Acorus calamus]|uniref:Uncharacterized protein n=1 Tax=Acorus calamus TaxID=4465 RepID=A0AAV9CBI3_ACOCL|nr:hypothetical protein QJS10_CPB20g00880 [Acorus calamus]
MLHPTSRDHHHLASTPPPPAATSPSTTPCGDPLRHHLLLRPAAFAWSDGRRRSVFGVLHDMLQSILRFKLL